MSPVHRMTERSHSLYGFLSHGRARDHPSRIPLSRHWRCGGSEDATGNIRGGARATHSAPSPGQRTRGAASGRHKGGPDPAGQQLGHRVGGRRRRCMPRKEMEYIRTPPQSQPTRRRPWSEKRSASVIEKKCGGNNRKIIILISIELFSIDL